MDKKKLTRRVAMGTAAGALAASPFILRALRGRYQADVPKGEFETEWEKYVKLFDVPIKDIGGDLACKLDYMLQPNERFRVVCVTATYEALGTPSASRYPEPPFIFTVGDADVTAVDPVVEGKPALLVDAHGVKVRSAYHHDERPGGRCIVVPTDGRFSCYSAGTDAPKRLAEGTVEHACVAIAAGITFAYPKGDTYHLGKKWIVPESSLYFLEIPCEVVGFASMAGRNTVKMVGERELDAQEYQGYIVRSTEGLKNTEKGSGKGVDIEAYRNGKLKLAEELSQSSKRVMAIRISPYVDTETGLVVRQEAKLTAPTPKGEQDTVVITQVIWT